MTTGTLQDAIHACEISLQAFHEDPKIVNLGGSGEADELLRRLPEIRAVQIIHMDLPDVPELNLQGIYGEVAMEKAEWKSLVKEQVKKILKVKPEAVYVEGNVFSTYPIIHILRKKHMPVLTTVEKDGERRIVRIPSGS